MGDIDGAETEVYRLKSGNLRKRLRSELTGSLGLAREVRHWQTPSANEDAAGTINGNMLSHQVQVATGITSTNDTGQRLNPLFVDTDAWGQVDKQYFPATKPPVRGVANGLARGLGEADKLRILGNGVVPQQAALAYTLLSGRISNS